MPDALMVSSSFLPGRGGIESYLAQLCEELAPRVAVLAPEKRDGKTIPDELAYSASGYPGTMLWPGRRVAAAIIEEAGRLGTDRIIFGTPWPLALLGPRLKRAGLSYAVIVHGAELLVPATIPVVNRKLAAALSEADLLFAVSDYTRRKIAAFLDRRGLPVPMTELLRARVDLARFQPERASRDLKSKLGFAPDDAVVLHFGRLVRRKGADRLIKVLPSVRQSIPTASLVIAGTGPETKRLKRLASKTAAPVVFTGRVSDDEASDYYATADLFALPVVDRWFGLDVEGLGVVLLEAAASGTPSVTGASGGTPEATVDRETGLVVDARSPEALTQAIVRILSDEELASKMGRAGREHVRREFSEKPLPPALLHWLGIEGGNLKQNADSPRKKEGGWS